MSSAINEKWARELRQCKQMLRTFIKATEELISVHGEHSDRCDFPEGCDCGMQQLLDARDDARELLGIK